MALLRIPMEKLGVERMRTMLERQEQRQAFETELAASLGLGSRTSSFHTKENLIKA